MRDRPKGDEFTLQIPLDASAIDGFDPEQPVQVAARSRDGAIISDTVRLNSDGKGVATLSFPDNPGSLRVVLGPENAAKR